LALSSGMFTWIEQSCALGGRSRKARVSQEWSAVQRTKDQQSKRFRRIRAGATLGVRWSPPFKDFAKEHAEQTERERLDVRREALRCIFR
jgi:hypothetical protein